MRDRELYTCDTPGCDGLKEVITPDGYVCRDCADELAKGYDAEPEMVADGGIGVDELREAVEEIDGGDPESIVTGFEAFFGHFVVEDIDVAHVEETLEEHGFEVSTIADTPFPLSQVNVEIADDPEIMADGGTDWIDLTGFQRDLLETIAIIESIGEDPYGLAIKERLEEDRKEVLHSRLYNNLDVLIDASLLERSELDGRTNRYTLTPEAKAMLEESIYRRAEACGIQVAVTDGGGGE
ncbi:hypothetical protein AB7C87_16990 [Natrarchaeobius sp. A-rgal3]|uniref:hypothetical protein n=1 Tax=Natrarchaeobius versutus TaxID=1679078 RepID=UPI003510B725